MWPASPSAETAGQALLRRPLQGPPRRPLVCARAGPTSQFGRPTAHALARPARRRTGRGTSRTNGLFLVSEHHTARSCEIRSPHAKKNLAQQTLFATDGKKKANRVILLADAPGRAKDPRKTNLARPAPFVWACRKWVTGARAVDEAARLWRHGSEWRRLERRRLKKP